MAHQIAVQRCKVTDCKFSMIVDYNLLAIIPHYASGLTISGPKFSDEYGNLKYPKLYALVQAILFLSHGNAYPEQGFSINKQLLESHGT